MFLFEKINFGPNPTKTIVYLLLPILFLLIIFPTYLQPNQAFISEYHDTLNVMIPEVFLMQNPLALWNNQWITGYSEISSLNSDRFYPFSFPFLLVSQNIFIINFILLLHLYIAYLAFYKFGSLLVKNPDLLMLFSMGYMFSGVLISRVFIGHILFVYAMAWIPLLYYFFLKITFKSEKSTFNIIAFALSETLIFIAGGTYYFFFCNAIIFIFFLYYIIRNKITQSNIIALTVSFALFFLLSSIKLIPNISVVQYIQRGDIINPLGDGGTLENNFASFIFGTPIDTVFGSYETMALIGIIPVLFAIIALIWGERDITVPSFYAIVFTLIWADGGRILLSGIHLLPLVSSFRNAGRIFGAIMPIVLLLSVYGVYIVQDRLRKGDLFLVSEDQKKFILYGVGVLAAVKVLELPWVAIPSLEAVLAVVLVFGFILLIYLDKAAVFNLQCYFTIALLIDILILVKNFTVLNEEVLFKGLIIAVILAAALLVFNRCELDKNRIKEHFFVVLLIVGIMVSIIGNISVLSPSVPPLDQSPALKVIEKMQEFPVTNSQNWVYETGWPIHHMDFTYWFIKNNIHPIRAYFSYYPKNMPPLVYEISGTQYYTADYIIDTAYLENGNQNLPEVTFKVDNISVYKPDHVLPNAFVVRNEQLIPAKIEKFTPDEVILSGPFLKGDVAVLKTAFYPGWKINSRDSSNVGNMVGTRLYSDTSSITYKFDPLDVKIGAILTGIGIIALLVLIIKRQECEIYLKGINKSVTSKKPHKGKKPEK
ncbi:MAG TPA: hypothetical protein VMW77_09930 [Methanoregula sp.]|nr:hypothetical protein [Methanoregula sp.]